MKLESSVASYLGLQSKVKETLTDRHLAVVAEVANGPVSISQVNTNILADLIAMHVLTVDQEVVRLGTAVFLEKDIGEVIKLATELGQALAKQLLVRGGELLDAPSEIRNFLGGIVASAQGPHHLLQEHGQAASWKDYEGPFAKTKVDFDEICPAFTNLGPALQLKSTLRGAEYTAVFIGPAGANFYHKMSLLLDTEHRSYTSHLFKFLTDSYGKLLAGTLTDVNLLRAAGEVGIAQEGAPKPILVTKDIYSQYVAAVRRVSEASCEIYLNNTDRIFKCLENTASGRQGVRPQDVIMHFGRYCRKILARELYHAGFFNDDVPSTGGITVFYENDIDDLNKYLS